MCCRVAKFRNIINLIIKFKNIANKIIRKFCISCWKITEKFGFYLVPKHFYFPIPDTKNLESYEYDRIFSLEGLSIDDESMKGIIEKN